MGSDAVEPEKDQNHPLMPDEVIYAGCRTPVNYHQPMADAQQRLNYRRNDVEHAVREAVAQVLEMQAQAA